MTTNTVLKAVLKSNGWNLMGNRKAGRGMRDICISKQFPYEETRTKVQQREVIRRTVEHTLRGEMSDVETIEWTNEDGGDFNTATLFVTVLCND